MKEMTPSHAQEGYGIGMGTGKGQEGHSKKKDHDESAHFTKVRNTGLRSVEGACLKFATNKSKLHPQRGML